MVQSESDRRTDVATEVAARRRGPEAMTRDGESLTEGDSRQPDNEPLTDSKRGAIVCISFRIEVEDYMARTVVLVPAFVERCLQDDELKTHLVSFQQAARSLIDAELRVFFGEMRMPTEQSLGHWRSAVELAEYNLRTACKARRVAVPNLTLSKLVQYALRRSRTTTPGAMK